MKAGDRIRLSSLAIIHYPTETLTPTDPPPEQWRGTAIAVEKSGFTALISWDHLADPQRHDTAQLQVQPPVRPGQWAETSTQGFAKRNDSAQCSERLRRATPATDTSGGLAGIQGKRSSAENAVSATNPRRGKT